MLLYLQSAVVMMDCLTVLSIISHTHKHNNNAVNINNKMFGLHMLHDNSSLDTVDIEQTWEMLQHCAPPEKPMCKPKSQAVVRGMVSHVVCKRSIRQTAAVRGMVQVVCKRSIS